MLKRKSNLFLFFLAISMALLGIMFLHASILQQMDSELLVQKGEVVGHLKLTDICLFTDARYTRHPSMADLYTPFQDYPLSLEHFPSGSITGIPPHLNHHMEEGKSLDIY